MTVCLYMQPMKIRYYILQGHFGFVFSTLVIVDLGIVKLNVYLHV